MWSATEHAAQCKDCNNREVHVGISGSEDLIKLVSFSKIPYTGGKSDPLL